VGDPGSNRALSQNRAIAIAKWFKKNGIVVAVYARGFGEDMLKVATPDNTDEEQNRRADYNVSENSPTGSLSGWTRVD
jgi:outer membrane protein OmpA-like peptidoglycan-associated protein